MAGGSAAVATVVEVKAAVASVAGETAGPRVEEERAVAIGEG